MTSELSPADPSAAPRRERGTRTRAGNAMGRTRRAVLDGAVRAVEKHGVRRATMADIASLSGIAKATLYNHFRTKNAVLAAAVDGAVRDLAEECAAVAVADGLARALAVAAERISTTGAVRRLAEDDPGALHPLTTVGDGPLWAVAREGVDEVLAAGGAEPSAPAVELVLRWLVSHVDAPAGDPAAGAALLAAALVTASG